MGQTIVYRESVDINTRPELCGIIWLGAQLPLRAVCAEHDPVSRQRMMRP
jgi:hypothetical protein